MQDLPNEIWWLIASHLPVEKVKSLYAVNRALFNISMDLRYPEVYLNTHPGPASRAKDIRFFRNPILAPRPKTFRIDLCFNPPKRKMESLLKRLFLLFFGAKKTQNAHLAELIEVVTAVAPRLTGVTTLEIFTCCHKVPPDADELSYSVLAQLMLPIWQHLRTQLQFIWVNCDVKDLAVLFPNSSLRMPSLETLALDACVIDKGTELNDIVAKVVVPCFTNHKTTLRNISVRIDDHDYSSIFPCLSSMQSLYGMKIFLPPEATPFAGRDTLIAHQASLKSLTLFYTQVHPLAHQGDSSFFSQDWCSVELPCLSELTLRLPRMPLCPQFLDYVHQFASSLVSLTIVETPDFRHEEIEEFCSRLVDFRSLQNLAMTIYGMSPANLAQVARALPRLRFLSLGYHYICADKDFQDFDLSRLVSSYYNEIGKFAQTFSDWELEGLDFGPDTTWFISFGPESMQSVDHRIFILNPLMEHLPNVQRFNQIRRQELVFCQNLLTDRYTIAADSSQRIL